MKKEADRSACSHRRSAHYRGGGLIEVWMLQLVCLMLQLLLLLLPMTLVMLGLIVAGGTCRFHAWLKSFVHCLNIKTRSI